MGTVVESRSPLWKVGDRVVLSYNFCGACPSCLRHAPSYCRYFFGSNFLGQRRDGSTALSRQGQPVRFGCSCSEDKVRQAMSIYSQKDIKHMTTEAGVVTADCQFCSAHYELDPKTLGFEAKNA